jgi:hypothetical protein
MSGVPVLAKVSTISLHRDELVIATLFKGPRGALLTCSPALLGVACPAA